MYRNMFQYLKMNSSKNCCCRGGWVSWNLACILYSSTLLTPTLRQSLAKAFTTSSWFVSATCICLSFHSVYVSKSPLSDITPSYYATTFIKFSSSVYSPLHDSASFIRPSSGGYFLSWSLLHLSAKPHVSCFVVHNKLSGGP
jgi:hypothetical protein